MRFVNFIVWVVCGCLAVYVVYDKNNTHLPVVVVGDLSQTKIAWELAEENVKIVKNQVAQDIRLAELNVSLSRYELKKYIESDLPRKINELNDKIALQTEVHRQWSDRAAWSRRMVGKGRFSRSQADSDELSEQDAKLKLDGLHSELRALKAYDQNRTILDLKNSVAKNETLLDIARKSGESRIQQAEMDCRYKLSEYQKRKQGDHYGISR